MYLALLSFAILKPSDWSDVAVFCVLGKAVEVPPATPVSAEAFIAVMMTSSILLFIAAAAALAYVLVGSINALTLSASSTKSPHSYVDKDTLRLECGVSI